MSGPSPRDGLSLLKSQACVKPAEPTASFAGETVIVTGANSGLGREAAKHLARLGAASVILAVRTVSKGEEARAYIERETGRKGVAEVWPLDLSSFDSVKAFAARAANLPRLDAVILNAGMWPSQFQTLEGNEATVTVNVVSTFLLHHLLLPTLRRSAQAQGTAPRVTVVDSALHKVSKLPARAAPSIFDELAKPLAAKDFDSRYNDSKLLVMLYGRALAAATPMGPVGGAPTGPVLNFVNPGWCVSELRRGGKPLAERMMQPLLQRTTDQGAHTLVDAVRPLGAKEAAARHGAYLDDCAVGTPAAWLETEDGRTTQGRVWGELNRIYERVDPAITRGL